MKISKICRTTIASMTLAVLLAGLSPAGASSLRIFSLSADQWARPRGGDMIPELEAVRAAVSYWERGGDSLLVIRHPGGDIGELWAAELRDWLISLGLPSDYIRLVPGTQSADQINLVVGNRDELEQ